MSVKKKWEGALRSGNYEQGSFQLRDMEGRYDAAGVLCDLAVRAGVIPEPEYRGPLPDGQKRLFYGYVYDGASVWVPDSVVEWAGIPRYVINRISLLGDHGKTFEELADYIKDI